jgi:single-strand DNA-binding protein
MNLVVLIGNLARDPEVRYSQNQMAIAKFTVAINRYVKDGDNQADFIRVTAFGKQGELVETYLRKGNKVAVEGRIQTGSYEDKDGKTVYTTDVIANRIEFVEKKGQGGSQGFGGSEPSFGGNFDQPQSRPPKQAPQGEPEIPEGFSSFEDDDDDVPF